MRVVYVEDDPDQATAATRSIEADGHRCRHFTTVSAMLDAVAAEPADLVLLDWNLPDATGEAALLRLRDAVSPCPPVVFVTAHDDEADLTRVLEIGASDFIPKPFERDALCARIAAYAQAPVGDAPGAGFEIDRDARVVRWQGEPASLDAVEFDLAACLFENAGRLVSKTRLAAVAGEADSRPLESRLSRLRAKLKLSPARGWQLRSVLRYGYRLEPVKRRT